MAEHGDEPALRIAWVDDDLGDLLAVAQTQVSSKIGTHVRPSSLDRHTANRAKDDRTWHGRASGAPVYAIRLQGLTE